MTQAAGRMRATIQAATPTTVWPAVARSGAWKVWSSGVPKASQPRVTPVTMRMAPTKPPPRRDAKAAGRIRRPRRELMTCIPEEWRRDPALTMTCSG